MGFKNAESSTIFEDFVVQEQGLEVRGQEQEQELVNWWSWTGSWRTRIFLEDNNTLASRIESYRTCEHRIDNVSADHND